LFLLLESVIPDAAELVCKKEGGLNRDVLQQALIGNTSLSGQHLWAVAIFAGHSTPEVTMGNYFHLSDWLLHRALDHLTVGRGQDPLLPLQLVAEDISLSVTVAQNRLRKLGLTESPAFALLLATHRDYVSAWRRPQQTDLPGPSVQGAVAVASSTTFPVVLTQPPGIKNKRGQTMSGLAVLSLLDELDTLYAGNSLMGSKGKVRAARTFEAIINLYDFSAEMANRLWSIVQQLEMIVGQSPSRRSKMQGMHGAVESVEFMGRQLIRPIKRMLLTRSSREAEAVNAACGWLRVAYSRDPESVLDWLALHWRYSDTENRLLRCAEMTPLANWLQIAKPLSEIPSVKECAKGLALTHRANGRPAAGSGKQQRSTWATGLGVVINSIDAGPVLQKPKGEFGIGFIDVSLPLRMAPASGGAEDHGQGKPTTGSPHRKFSLVLDAAAYVVLIDVLMGCN
jgi:hypothetical protein